MLKAFNRRIDEVKRRVLPIQYRMRNATKEKQNRRLTWNGKGLALYNLGRYEEAIKHYDKALELNPNDSRNWYNRACTKVLTVDIENGLADLRMAIEMDAEYIELA